MSLSSQENKRANWSHVAHNELVSCGPQCIKMWLIIVKLVKFPITYLDRIPIEGDVVSTEPVFSHFYVDALGRSSIRKSNTITVLCF